MTAIQEIRGSIQTDVGRRRQLNEDWCGSHEPRSDDERRRDGWLWIVADGVGAYGTGEEASRAAGEAILAAYRGGQPPEPGARLRRAVEIGNGAVWERRREYVRRGESRPVMSTVLALAIVGERALVANVGDCRAYLIREGRIQQITRDHTWVGEEIQAGRLRPEDARQHPRRHMLTRSLGQYETVEVDLQELRLAPGDRLVLCSDGLTEHLRDGEILRLAASTPAQVAAGHLIETANARGGADNITVAVIEVPPAPLASQLTPPIPNRRPAAPAPIAPAPAPPPPRPTPAPPQPRPAPTPAPPKPTASPAMPKPTPPPDPPPATPAASRRPPDTAPPPTAVGAADRPRGDYLAALKAIGERFSASLDLDETLRSAIASIVELTGAQGGFIILRDESGNELVHSAGGGGEAPTFSRSIVQSVFESGRPMEAGDAMADPALSQHQSIVLQNLRSILCAPLEVKGKRIGVVYVEHRLDPDVFVPADLELLCAFAGQAAVAVENARLYEQLRQQVAANAAMRTNQENALRSINSAIVSLDTAGRVLIFNPPAEELLGVRAERALGRTLAELLPSRLQRTLRALLDGQDAESDGADPDSIELTVSLPHRGSTTLSVRVLPLADADKHRTGSLLILNDISQQRELEQVRQREATTKERLRASFSRYLAPTVIEQLMEDPGSVRLGGERREVTVMFCDIRGFTGISERNEPEEVVAILNSYLACATDVILEAGGTLDKFLGDGVMAFFNAPLPQEGHALAAVRAALEMQARLREQRSAHGHRVAFGVGINSGEGVVGNIGTSDLMNYTVIGDVVNVSSRLCSEARAGEVLISGAVYEQVASAVEVEELGSIHLKGRAQPISVLKVIRVVE